MGEERGVSVAAISSKRQITMMDIRSTRMLGQQGFLARVFAIFKKFDVSVDIISTSEVSISLTLDPGFKPVNLAGLRAELESIASVEVSDALSMLTVVAPEQALRKVLRTSLCVLEDMGVEIEMVSHGASNVNV